MKKSNKKITDTIKRKLPAVINSAIKYIIIGQLLQLTF